MVKEKKKFLECSCYSEGILVSKFDDENEFYFSFWSRGINPTKLTAWTRIKLCCKVLFTGQCYGDEVILSQELSKELANFIDKNTK